MYGYDIFHDSIMEKLIRSVREGNSSHAYLFAGEKGLGKLTAARLLANTLVCGNTKIPPCGTCSACVQAKAKTNPDIIYVDTGDKKSIGVEVIREINESVFIKPFGKKSKVYIIEDGSLMTEGAQNAFLKTLEEPPSYGVFIIICDNIESMLQTIISRCTVVKFSRVKKDILRSYAQKYNNADFLVNFSEGNPGKIDRYMNDADYRALREKSVKMLKELFSHKALSAYTVADFMEQNKENVIDILDFWIVLVRDILVSTYTDEAVINSDIIKFLKKQGAVLDENYLINAMNIINNAHEMCQKYVNVKAIALYMALKIKKL